MFARGLVSLHTPPLPGRKSFEAKSRVSISSKLIENKRLQVLYSGHLRKIGGRGSYRLVHTVSPLGRNSPPLSPIIPALARPSLNLFPFYIFPATGGRVPRVQPRLLTVDCSLLAVCESWATSSISFISPAYEHQPCISLVSPTYAKTGGWGVIFDPTFMYYLKCRRADIFAFPHDFSHFLAQSVREGACPERATKGLSPRARLRRRPLHKHGIGESAPVTNHESLVTPPPPIGYITAVLRSYCVGRCQNGSWGNPGMVREPAPRVCPLRA